jgi:hypothetical protein
VDKSLEKELKELKERYSTSQAAIEGYKQELERVNSLRQRRPEPTVPSTATMSSPSIAKQKLKPMGIDLQVVLILCLVSFLLGALLF